MLRKALDEQSALLTQYPGIPEYQLEVGRGRFQLGLLLAKSSKLPEAVLEAEQAKGLYNDVLKTWPDSELAFKYILENQVLLGQALIGAGRLADAAATAEQLPALHPIEPKFYVHAVALLINCAKAAAGTADGRKLAEDCLVRAVGILRNAIQAKVISSKAKLDLPDFAPLRDRDDFKRLRDSLDDSVHIG